MATAMVAVIAMPEAAQAGAARANGQGRTANVSIAVRFLVGAALVALLIITVMAGLGTVLRNSAPARALAIAPWNAQAAGLLSQQLLLEGPAEYARAARLADKALRRDPTAVAAIVTLATVHDVQGDGAAALRMFSYAGWLTRRHLPAELWWIEHAVNRGDVALALRHYDIALRASSRAPDILFPILGSAIMQDEVRRELTGIFARDPSWRPRFFQWLVANGVSGPGAAALLLDMRRQGQDISADIEGGIERVLVEAGDYASAWNLYSAGRALRRDRSRDSDFAAVMKGRNSPFDWTVVEDQGSASVAPEDGRHVLTFTASGNGGVLARQLQRLPPGRYDLRDDVQIERITGAGEVYWALTCVDGREVGRVSIGAAARVPQNLVVPENCDAQWLELVSEGGESLQGNNGVVRKVLLQRVGA